MTALQLGVLGFQFLVLWFVTIWQRHRKRRRKDWEARGYRDVHSVRLSRLNSQRFQRIGWVAWVLLTQWEMLHGYVFLYPLFFGVWIWLLVWGIGRYWFYTRNPYGPVALEEMQGGMVKTNETVLAKVEKGSAVHARAADDSEMLEEGR